MESKEISKSELERVYKSLTVIKTAEYFETSIAGLYYMLDKAGIPRKKPESTRKEKKRLIITD